MDDNGGISDLNQAKLILITVFSTVFIILALVYLLRTEILEYVFGSLESDIEQMIPAAPDFVTNEDRVIAAIQKVNPAVVSIIVTKDVPVYEQYYEIVNPWGLFDGFSVPRIRENGTKEQEVGGGSGFLVGSDGLIVTNRHVVEDEEARYSVVLSDGTFFDVDIVDRDPTLDVAVLKINDLPEEKLPFVQFGDSSALQLGQTVIAIGNALAEFQNSVSLGVVSGLGRSILASDSAGNSEQLNQVIQTDAAINPGNSGGPLLNLDGEVVGVNVATSRGADNIGFALPSQFVVQVVESVKEHGEIIRPFLGVRYVMVDEDIQSKRDLSVVYGALIIDGNDGSPAVEIDSPAHRAGLVAGDVVLAIDDVSLRGLDLATELRNKEANQTVELLILRNGIEEIIEVTLGKAL